ncbi:SDR family oxidoreductase [Breoghania sp. L-A4]|uniref:SDR family oxidoreductase n=1 Tax=Breoghania sp. L-A4 TaxID=2304600 RepID=UPI000E358075|nr:SDR family oxidoreductase [Breoghania sp. L-A4]AXS41440.1 SDR family oxidoreductase [Breoghania sp. L-A4]
MIAVTGATGQLGRHVIEELLQRMPAGDIVAAVRDPAKAADLAARGVVVREADYSRPETLRPALRGADKLLLISSSEVGQRASQHRAVIDAALAENIGLVAYTSVLHADTSLLTLAIEHRDTEAALRDSGLPHVLLRNGWYTENYLAALPAVLLHGAVIGAAGEGRIASAARQDYARAAATVLTSPEQQAGRVYELAGDDSYTLADLAAEIAAQSRKPIVYMDLSESDYTAALVSAGVPAAFAVILAQSDVSASQGALFDDSRAMSTLIGAATTPLATSVAHALAA